MLSESRSCCGRRYLGIRGIGQWPYGIDTRTHNVGLRVSVARKLPNSGALVRNAAVTASHVKGGYCIPSVRDMSASSSIGIIRPLRRMVSISAPRRFWTLADWPHGVCR
jgi:hypothetical protein